jgi:hypothetical protein
VELPVYCQLLVAPAATDEAHGARMAVSRDSNDCRMWQGRRVDQGKNGQCCREGANASITSINCGLGRYSGTGRHGQPVRARRASLGTLWYSLGALGLVVRAASDRLFLPRRVADWVRTYRSRYSLKDTSASAVWFYCGYCAYLIVLLCCGAIHRAKVPRSGTSFPLRVSFLFRSLLPFISSHLSTLLVLVLVLVLILVCGINLHSVALELALL